MRRAARSAQRHNAGGQQPIRLASTAAAAARSRQQRAEEQGLVRLGLRVQTLRENGDWEGADRLARLEDWSRSGMQRTPGFFEPALIEAYWLLDEAQRAHGVRGGVGEIGVYCGRSFIPLALLRRSDGEVFVETALAIDCFEGGQAANLDASGVGDRSQFESNLAAAGVPCDVSVTIMSADSLEIKPSDLTAAAAAARPHTPRGQAGNNGHGEDCNASFDDGQCDMTDVSLSASREGTGQHASMISSSKFRLFSIDGSHTEEAVQSDLALVDACLEEGGVVLVDDALNADWPAVTSGMIRFILSAASSPSDPDVPVPVTAVEPLKPFALAYNKCFLARGDWCGVYRRALAPLERKTAVFLGSEISILPAGFTAAHFANDLPREGGAGA